MRLTIDSGSPQETLAIGQALGRLLVGGEVIGIAGELGAGKTQLVRGLAQGLDIDRDVVYSPSFTLVAEHEGRLRLNHIDLFRLAEPVSRGDEEEIGLVEYLSPRGVTAIEWHRKLDVPSDAWTLEIDLAAHEGERRTIAFSTKSPHGRALVEGLARAIPTARIG
jgi:tRNA threonylcarbamoyladenosine biosynthesis protein TsaE